MPDLAGRAASPAGSGFPAGHDRETNAMRTSKRLHVWDRHACRWRIWRGSLRAWKALPHAVVGAVCTLPIAAVLASHRHPPALHPPTAPPVPATVPAPVPVRSPVYLVGLRSLHPDGSGPRDAPMIIASVSGFDPIPSSAPPGCRVTTSDADSASSTACADPKADAGGDDPIRTVPEPGGLVLMGAGLCLIAWRRSTSTRAR